jgi:hypothetical protein
MALRVPDVTVTGGAGSAGAVAAGWLAVMA